MATILEVAAAACVSPSTVSNVINGRGGSEYWALQCVACQGVHLDIVEPPTRH